MSEDSGVDFQTVQAAMDRFVRTLERSLTDLASEKDQNAGPVRRDRYVLALTGVLGFLQDIEAAAEYQNIFANLAFSLIDLDDGVVDAALVRVPRRKGGHPSDPSSWWLHRARMCVR